MTAATEIEFDRQTIEKFELIQKFQHWAKKINPNDLLMDGQICVADDPNKGLQLVRILKTDARGVIKTSAGINFSTRCYPVSSTKKYNDRYLNLYFLEDSYESALKQQERESEAAIARKRSALKRAIDQLSSKEEIELIDRLLTILEEEGKA